MKPKNILVITYWSFDNALIQTYTLPYIKQISHYNNGGKIYLFCLAQRQLNSTDYKNQISELKKERIFLLNFSYSNFGFLMIVKLALVIKYLIFFSYIKNIHSIHAWCTPGGAIGYIVSVITRKKLILDSFEPHAETMVEGNTWRKNSLAYRLLFKLEKLQLKRASEVICTTKSMIKHSQETYLITKPRYFVKPACVNLELFNITSDYNYLKKELNLKENVCVYAGKFGGIYLEQEVFDFFKVALDYWEGDFSVLLLTSHSDEEIKNYCELANLPQDTIVKKFVPHHQVPAYLSLGTFGFCPVKPLPSKEFCTPIKNGEYWAMGLPVVITKNISNDSEIIEKNNAGYVLKALTKDEYIIAVKKIESLKDLPNIRETIRLIAIKERNFTLSDLIYKTIYA